MIQVAVSCEPMSTTILQLWRRPSTITA